MQDLIYELEKHGRSFPIGLSGNTGIGYILTGGISPLSSSQGLAIDQIVKICGFWGYGNQYELIQPNKSSSIDSDSIRSNFFESILEDDISGCISSKNTMSGFKSLVAILFK